jgi:hypothetical protein
MYAEAPAGVAGQPLVDGHPDEPQQHSGNDEQPRHHALEDAEAEAAEYHEGEGEGEEEHSGEGDYIGIEGVEEEGEQFEGEDGDDEELHLEGDHLLVCDEDEDEEASAADEGKEAEEGEGGEYEEGEEEEDECGNGSPALLQSVIAAVQHCSEADALADGADAQQEEDGGLTADEQQHRLLLAAVRSQARSAVLGKLGTQGGASTGSDEAFTTARPALHHFMDPAQQQQQGGQPSQQPKGQDGKAGTGQQGSGAPKVCEVCGSAPSKYCCPGCERRTCSLACSKKHKVCVWGAWVGGGDIGERGMSCVTPRRGWEELKQHPSDSLTPKVH